MAVVDPEAIPLNPLLRPNFFIFMGIFKKNEVKSANRTHFIHLNPLSGNPGSAPERDNFTKEL